MNQFFIFILTVFLVLVSLFTVLIVLMQKPTSNGGLGSSLGGGAAEMAFGGETTRVLNKWTIYGVILFFIVSFSLSIMHVAKNSSSKNKLEMPKIIEKA